MSISMTKSILLVENEVYTTFTITNILIIVNIFILLSYFNY